MKELLAEQQAELAEINIQAQLQADIAALQAQWAALTPPAASPSNVVAAAPAQAGVIPASTPASAATLAMVAKPARGRAARAQAAPVDPVLQAKLAQL